MALVNGISLAILLEWAKSGLALLFRRENGEPSFLDHETYHKLNSIPLPEINQPVILQPIPRTLEPELVNGKIQVWAELLTDGGETPDEVGFIISQMITDWEDHPSTEIKLASLENGYFEVLLDESLADGTYYIRSFLPQIQQGKLSVPLRGFG